MLKFPPKTRLEKLVRLAAIVAAFASIMREALEAPPGAHVSSQAVPGAGRRYIVETFTLPNDESAVAPIIEAPLDGHPITIFNRYVPPLPA